MAHPQLRLNENAEGEFFVDSTCIDCDTCRQLAPDTFRDHGEQSSVYRQPETEDEIRKANMALVACPTGSIGAGTLLNAAQAIDSFPQKISENVFYCGFNSEASFGAWSYLIVREKGNVLVDSPRFASHLVKKFDAAGGISRIFLTHADDVADQAEYAARFSAERIMHAADGARRLGAEHVIEGTDAVRIDEQLTVIPVPGHTRGSQVLLYKNKFLFTGDHLAWSPERGTLTAFRSVCWYSWAEQIRSMERLADFDFEWVLPGHGRIAHRPKTEMKEHLKSCIQWMKRV